MTDNHDYKAALDGLNEVECDITAIEWFEKYCGNKDSVAVHALKLADKVTGEPSDEMVLAAIDRNDADEGMIYEGVFKAMRDQMIREIHNV